MTPRRRPRVRVSLLGVGLGMALGWSAGCQPSGPPGGGPGGPTTSPAVPDAPITNAAQLDVRLDRLDRPVPPIATDARSPFQFGREPGPDARTESPPQIEPVAEVPPPRPFRSPVRIDMIGLVEGEERVGRIAVLTDGEAVFHGEAGDIVEGRYRILQITPTSVEIELIEDGRRYTAQLAP